MPEPAAPVAAPAAVDPAKLQADLHASAVAVAKAVSDAYYKVDAALSKIPADSEVATQLKAVQDNLFLQKNQAEQVVQSAGGTQPAEAQPPAPPVSVEPVDLNAPDPMAASPADPMAPPVDPASAAPVDPALPPAPAEPAPVPPSAAPVPAMASSRQAAAVPSAQAEKIWELLGKHQPGKVGSMSCDGQIVTLGGKPIFKITQGLIMGSWAGTPSMTVAANVNSLAVLAGIGRVFSLHDGDPTFRGRPVQADGWIALGTLPAKVSSRQASFIPKLLLPRPKV